MPVTGLDNLCVDSPLPKITLLMALFMSFRTENVYVLYNSNINDKPTSEEVLE